MRSLSLSLLFTAHLFLRASSFSSGNQQCSVTVPQHSSVQRDDTLYKLLLANTPSLSASPVTSFTPGQTYYILVQYGSTSTPFRGFSVRSSEGSMSPASNKGQVINSCTGSIKAVTHTDFSSKSEGVIATWVAPSSTTSITLELTVVQTYNVYSYYSVTLSPASGGGTAPSPSSSGATIPTPTPTPTPTTPTPSGVATSPPYTFTASLSPTLTLHWNLTTPTQLTAQLTSSVGGWASFTIAQTENTMGGLDGVLVQPSLSSTTPVSQITVGEGHSQISISTVPSSLSTLSSTSFTALPDGGWRATFSRPTSAGPYNGALSMDVSSSAASTIVTTAWGERGVNRMINHGRNTASARVSFSSGTVEGVGKRDTKLVTAHGVLMYVAWGLLFPLGAGLSRWRNLLPASPSSQWFHLHRGVQGVGWVMTLGGLACIVAYVASRPHFTSSVHSQLGLATFLVGFLQPLNALIRPHTPGEGMSKAPLRTVWEVVHKGWGWAAILFLAPATIILGLLHYGVSPGVVIAYAVVLGLQVLVGGCLEGRAWSAHVKPLTTGSHNNALPPPKVVM